MPRTLADITLTLAAHLIGDSPDLAALQRRLHRLACGVAVIALAEHRGVLPLPTASPNAQASYRASLSLAELERDGEGWVRLRRLGDALTRGDAAQGVPRLGEGLWSSLAEAWSDAPASAVGAFVGEIRRELEASGWRFERLGEAHARLLALRLTDDGADGLVFADASARRTTGSYYSPPLLVESLLDTALEPALAGALAEDDPEAALLALAVCDPACGTGRFLIAAGRRIAARLEATRRARGLEGASRALRDVVGACLYGVDLQPLTVELCRAALWLEVGDPEVAPSALGRHVRCGNALLGATPALMAAGIPSEAFTREAPTAAERPVARRLRRRNRRERGDAAEGAPPDDVALADAWCAAFVWPLRDGALEAEAMTEGAWRRAWARGLSSVQRRQVEALREAHRFVHWHLEFPEVFERGGFDVVVGNPPFVNAIEGGIGPVTRALSRYAHPELSGTADLAFFFVSQATRIARDGGWIGLVQPRAILNAASARRLREASPRPVAVAAPERSDLFPGAAVFVCLLTLGPGARCRVTRDPELKRWVEGELAGSNWWRGVMELTSGAALTPSPDATPLSERFEVAASMTTGDAYRVKPHVRDGEAGEGLKLVTTGLIEPDRCMWGEWTCRYLKDDYQRPVVPVGVSDYPPALVRRLERARRPKVIVAGLTARIEAFVDRGGEFTGAVSTWSIFEPTDDVEALEWLCAVLLSDEATRRFRMEVGGNALGGGNITMKKAFLRGFPLPPRRLPRRDEATTTASGAAGGADAADEVVR